VDGKYDALRRSPKRARFVVLQRLCQISRIQLDGPVVIGTIRHSAVNGNWRSDCIAARAAPRAVLVETCTTVQGGEQQFFAQFHMMTTDDT
jgi:hypothetical protein